jgi:hypothetical protein
MIAKMRSQAGPSGNNPDKPPSGMSDTVKGALIGAVATVAAAVLAAVIGHSAGVVYIGTSPSPLQAPTNSPNPTTSPQAPTSRSLPVEGPGAEVNSGTFNIPDTQDLSYPNGAGNEVIFYYEGTLGYLEADQDVNLAILRAPAPAPDTAYQACKHLGKYTQRIGIDTLAAGDSLCAFTPNNQVSWIRFLGTKGQSGSDLTLQVAMITWKATGS